MLVSVPMKPDDCRTCIGLGELGDGSTCPTCCGTGDNPDAALLSPGGLLCLAYAWSNISKDQLVNAGVIGNGHGGSDWKRFNDDPMMFIMKLPPERLPALCQLLS